MESKKKKKKLIQGIFHLLPRSYEISIILIKRNYTLNTEFIIGV